jgi:hypothetical protein
MTNHGIHRKLAITTKNMFFEYPAQESHLKFSVIHQMDKDLWGDITNTEKRPQQPIGFKMWKVEDDEVLLLLSILHINRIK